MKNMKNKMQITKVVGLALCLGAAPLLTLVTGCAGDRYHESTGESIDDHTITMRVKDALSNDSQYKFEGVNVDTFKGTVQLSGFVDTSDQKDRAATLAKGVQGVKDVDNNITVKN
jgi:osmotically-inducible protein OsmY